MTPVTPPTTVKQWAKWLTTVAAAIGVLWKVVAWGLHVQEGAERAKQNHATLADVRSMVEDLETQQMLIWCGRQGIVADNCKREWEAR